jgi:glycine/D-amino acid oxidase-like deaminating enzyme
LRLAFADAGGTILVGRGSVLLEDEGPVVRIGEDRIEASSVVVATGAETAALLDRLGWEIPMDPSPGLLALTGPVEPFLEGTVYVYPEDGTAIHLRQAADGRVIVGERAQDEVAKSPTLEHARLLLRQAQKAFPILREVAIERFTVEWRPMPRDKMPIVGPLPGLPSLYVATAHSGVTLAPALGKLVAEEIMTGAPIDRLRPFRPSRFSEHEAAAYQEIEAAFSASSEAFIG